MQRRFAQHGYDGSAAEEEKPADAKKVELPPPPVVTEHEISIGRKRGAGLGGGHDGDVVIM